MPQIVSIGELLVEVMRPQRDMPLDSEGLFYGPFPSGAPAIFINQVAKLGVSAALIGVCGDDGFGKLIVNYLQKNGVDTTHIRYVKDYTTGCAFVAYRTQGSRQFIFHLSHSAAALLNEKDVYLADAKLLHIMGSSLAVSPSSKEACYKAVEIIKSKGGVVSFDPNLRPELLPLRTIKEICRPVVEAADIILPSGEEASMLTGIEDADAACRALLNSAMIVGLKMGAHGSKIFTRDEEIRVPTIQVEEVDPTGAGDCWDAGFTVAYLEGKTLKSCAQFANIVGALSVTKFGPMAGSPTRIEVEKKLRKEVIAK